MLLPGAWAARATTSEPPTRRHYAMTTLYDGVEPFTVISIPK
jgi:hypothetical protein